jgi:uncharacterized protein
MSVHAAIHDDCRDEMEALVRDTRGVESAAVISGDGFEVASVLRAGVSGEKLAAMASSLLALSEAVVSELRMSSCRNVIIESEHGVLVTMRIPVSDRELLMSVLCSNASTLGAVLFAARSTAQSLSLRIPPRA